MAGLFRVGLLVSVTACGTALAAEDPPPWPVHRLCAEAQGILVGERCGATTVRIDEWLSEPAAEAPAAGGEIEIVGLEEHSRALRGRGPEGEHRMLRTQRVICFLERKGRAWSPLAAAPDGSAGLFWIEEGTCFRYRRRVLRGEWRPAGWELERARDCQSEAAMRALVARGLADRRGWEAALEIRHPAEQAVVLASYLLARTSPEGVEDTYRSRVRQTMPKLGAAAVRELEVLLASARPEDDLGPALTVLADLGPEANPALPLVTALLDRPAQAKAALVLEALGRIGDAAVAPVVLPFLTHRDLEVRAEAAKALAAFRYQDAARDIAAGLPAGVDQDDAWNVYVMLAALRDLDGARAATCARNYLDRPAMIRVRDLLEPLLRE